MATADVGRRKGMVLTGFVYVHLIYLYYWGIDEDALLINECYSPFGQWIRGRVHEHSGICSFVIVQCT